MIRMNKFLSEESIKKARELAKLASTTPIIMVGNVDASSMAWDDFYQFVKEKALEQGLEDIQGYYGVDLSNGEFVK